MTLRPPVERWLRLARHEQIVLSVLAVLVGVAIGHAAVLFRLAIGAVQRLAFGFADEAMLPQVFGLEWWHILLAPAVGGLALGLFLRWAMPGGRAQAVPEVIEAVALRNAGMDLKAGLFAAGVSAWSLGVGGSAGREGPVVHLGATLAAWVAERLKMSPALSRTLLGCGVAAAIASSFNAPIAGMFFALEVVLGHYALSAFAPVVIASVAGAMIGRAYFGASAAFAVPLVAIVSPLELPAFALLGVVAAGVAMVFMWSITFATDTVDSLPVPDWLKPAAGGLAIGALAVHFPQILGVGYAATDAALRAELGLAFMVWLVFLKTSAAAITLGCRFGGGVFSPALFLGAMTGGAFGIVAAWLVPETAASHGAYALVGMAAVSAPVLGAPISTILMVFELTSDYQMTIASMIAATTATVIVQQAVGRSFFHLQLQRRGLDLRGGRARHILTQLRVRDAMSRDVETVPASATIGEIKRRLMVHPDSTFAVVGEADRLIGTVSFVELSEVAFEPSVDLLLNAADAARMPAVVVTPEDRLERVLEQMEFQGEEHVPVVADRTSDRVAGLLHRTEVLRVLNRALFEAHAEEHDEVGDLAPGGRQRRRAT